MLNKPVHNINKFSPVFHQFLLLIFYIVELLLATFILIQNFPFQFCKFKILIESKNELTAIKYQKLCCSIDVTL